MSLSNKKILIVEDEEPILRALVDKFTREGFETLEARNGEEGLEIALREHPDLILLDIIMPKMDGMTMLHKLREDTWGEQVPVIILTNLSEAEKMKEAMEAGVFDFLVKTNWRLEDVVKKVREKLEEG